MLPLSCILAIGPAIAMLQHRAVAPLALVGLLGVVLWYGATARRLPWPNLAAQAVAAARSPGQSQSQSQSQRRCPSPGLLALLLFGWAVVASFWSPDWQRGVESAARCGLFVLLGLSAARVAAEAGTQAQLRLARCLFWGVAAGLILAVVDDVSGNAIRAAVRGMAHPTPDLMFGLKPAASFAAVLLPVAMAAPLPPFARLALGLLGGIAILILPGDAAKIAIVAAGVVWLLARRWPRGVPRLLGLLLALTLLLMPLVLTPILNHGFPAAWLPPSAAHRLLIWDFVDHRIAEHPLFGWGMESSRAIPGGDAGPSMELLHRFGLDHPGRVEWFHRPGVQLLPLHPHNAALQLWLELGLPGVLLAAALCLGLGRAASRCPDPAAAAATLVSAAVTGLLSFGAWQPWWIGAELLAVAALAALPRRGTPAD